MKTIPNTTLELRAELLRRGYTLNQFAREHGFAASTFKKYIQRYWMTGKSPSGDVGRRVIQCLCDFLHISPSDLNSFEKPNLDQKFLTKKKSVRQEKIRG